MPSTTPPRAISYRPRASISRPRVSPVRMPRNCMWIWRDPTRTPVSRTRQWRRTAGPPSRPPIRRRHGSGSAFSTAARAMPAPPRRRSAKPKLSTGNRITWRASPNWPCSAASATARDQCQASDAYLRRALETARLAGNIHQEVLIKLRLSTNAYASGDAATAEREAGEALEAARLHRIDSLAVRGLINLGAALMRKRDAAGAEQHFREGLAMAEAANNQWLAALSRAWLASLYDSTGRSAQAEQEAASALAFYRSNRYAKESFQCFTILARQRVRAEDYKGALDLFQQASAEAAKVQDANLAAQAEESSGLTLEAQERYPQALAHYDEMLRLATSDERRGYANLNRGQSLWKIGRYSDAEEAFRAVDAAAPKFPSLHISLLRARAAMALSREQYPEAKDLANQALEAEANRQTGLHAELLGILGRALVHAGNQ